MKTSPENPESGSGNFAELMLQAKQALPDAFDAQGRLLAPIAGKWMVPSQWFVAVSPVDLKDLAEIPAAKSTQAAFAVEATAMEHSAWAARSLTERISLVARAVDLLRAHRDLLVRILAWEIGKTMPAAYNDVDRCIAGIEWYLEEIGPMLEGRRPLGLVSNIASWNYPFSVLLLNVLVQALVGNAVVAKIPTQGGGVSLTLAFGLLRHADLPVTLVGGRGKDLTEPLVGHPIIAGVAFVGGRANGAAISERLRGTGKRYALEMEGVNAYTIIDFTDWEGLGKQIRAGFDFGKQRCTAYTRWVVERSLVPRFVETYVEAVSTLRVGHPLLGIPVDFGPLISSAKVQELCSHIAEAKTNGAEVLYEGKFAEDAFTAKQDRDAYFAPTLLLGVKTPSDLYHREPFGPVDVLAPVDSEEEIIAEANVSSGALVASVATDDPAVSERIAGRLHAFKVGVNRLRSRGDREEPFGGAGRSWEGAFVGGANLVRAFTDGLQRPHGNWLD